MKLNLALLQRQSERLLPALCWTAALGLAAWVGAGLFWQIATPAAPAAVPRFDSDPRHAAAAILRDLDLRPAAATDTAAPAAAETYRVVAVATGFGTLPGFAILQTPDERSFSLTAGERLPDGRRLERILADRIVLSASHGETELAVTAAPRADEAAAPPPAPPPVIRRPSTSTD